ncbi:MAG TPA: LytR C-terminal domain-containing protein [Acidimicrobiales bacterium]|nr:LytR C-terminal domain-containing protein [Acidimicrobiales bacterium]
MSRGQHASDDNSFSRSASGAMLRGVALVAVAVILGIFLLQATDSPDPQTLGNGDDPVGVDDEVTTTIADEEELPATPTTEAAPDPSTITVLVANGASVAGLAGDVTGIVTAAGFQAAAPTNVTPGEEVEESIVYYTPGFEEAAETVAAVFEPMPEVAALTDPPPVDDLAGANVVVVAGPDLAADA